MPAVARAGSAERPPQGCGLTLRSLACFGAGVRKADDDDTVVLVNAANLDLRDQTPREEDAAGGRALEPAAVRGGCSPAPGSSCCGVPAGDSTVTRSAVDRLDQLQDEEPCSEEWLVNGSGDGLFKDGVLPSEDETLQPMVTGQGSHRRDRNISWNAAKGGHGAEEPDAAGAPPCTLDSVALAAAVDGGRWLEAQRILEGCAQGAPAAALERARRIGARYSESLEELRCTEDYKLQEAVEWTEEFDSERGFAFAFRLADSTFQVVSSRVYEGFDAFQAFVGLCEYDLRKEYDAQVVEAECLREGEGEEVPTDSIYHVFKQAHSGKEDNIWQVSCVDALDEPLGALWFSTYTPAEEGLTELRGVPLPQARRDAVRVGFWRTAYAVVPLWTAVPSFRLTFALCRRPSSAAYIFSSVVNREIGRVLDNFGDFLHRCHDLNLRAVSSERAPFYERVRRHLEAVAPKGCLAPAASPMLRLGFSELSALLPEDWADHAEEAAAVVAPDP